MEITQPSLFEKLNRWIRESIMVKLGSIGFLILILMIPQVWIQSLISERQERANSVVGEVASKWSGPQTISGPILVIPVVRREKIDKGKDGIEVREHIARAFFLPEKLVITGNVNPTVLHRGIFDAAVYQSSLQVAANFSNPDFQKFDAAAADVVWKDAYLIAGISDLRGISENPEIKMGDASLSGEPSNNIGMGPVYSTDQDYRWRGVPLRKEL